jgi:hypothetical protein
MRASIGNRSRFAKTIRRDRHRHARLGTVGALPEDFGMVNRAARPGLTVFLRG